MAAATLGGAHYLRFPTAVLTGWCLGTGLYLAFSLYAASRQTAAGIKSRAEQFDLGSGFIFFVTAFAALACLIAIVSDLGHVKQATGGLLLLSGATLVLSWLFVHTVFAFHYAHLYYLNSTCIIFPGTDKPDYWDFIYFAMVIGMTAQVSDVTTGSANVRRLVLAHSVISFFFNTAILALGVNLTASAVG
jgi:uncharacterized membrane protein